MSFVQKYMFLDGQIENCFVIIDMHFLGIGDISTTFIKKLIGTFQNAFKSTMYKMYIVNATFLTNLSYKVLSMFLDSNTKEKIKLFSKANPSSLLKFINKEQLLKDYGGAASNPPNYWFC